MSVATKEYWDKAWKSESNSNHSTYGYYLTNPEGKSVLDIGCGDMFYHKMFYYPSLVGIDISFNALKQSKESFRDTPLETPLITGDALRLPFKDNSFEIATCMDTLTLMGTDFIKILYEMRRVAKEKIIFTLTHQDIARIYIEPPYHQCDYHSILHESELDKIFFQESSIDELASELDLDIEEMECFTMQEIHDLGSTRDNLFRRVEHAEVKGPIYVDARIN